MNPLLAKVKLPGRIFQLPSKGVFYGPGMFATGVKDAEIEVKPMSALTELKLRSPDLLFSGKALVEVCAECVPDLLQPNKLATKDVDALFCFLKIATYGAAMTVSSMHDCKNAQVHQYEVNLETFIGAPHNESLASRDVTYQVILSNGQRVKLKPISFEDSIKLTHMKQEIHREFAASGNRDPANSSVEALLIVDLLSVIEGVEADTGEGDQKILITDRTMLEEWARSLQRKWIDEISAQALRCDVWGFKLKAKLFCKDCKAVYEHDLEVDPINFFFG